MDYYERKMKAMDLIKLCKENGLDFDETYFQVLKTYALGKKFVRDYYTLLPNKTISDKKFSDFEMKKGEKKAYKKPVLKKERTMNFPVEIINDSNKRIVCRQCSSCHGCR